MREAGWLEWSVFAALVAVLLVVDIGYASRGERGQSVRKAWTWSLLWIGVALAFGAWIALRLGSQAGLDYLTAYVLEKSLSIDNLAVFAVVFAQTGVPPALQRRALLWGVIGALLMRAVLIAFGIYALQRFHWLVYPFGALLAYAAIQTLRGEAGRRPWVQATCALCSSWVSRILPIVPTLHGDRFVARIDGKRFATPLLVALIAIESADLVFAIDSIPAVLSVTQDPFLVYSSNIFALLGLRALYGVDRRPVHALLVPARRARGAARLRRPEAGALGRGARARGGVARHHRLHPRRRRARIAPAARAVAAGAPGGRASAAISTRSRSRSRPAMPASNASPRATPGRTCACA